MINIIKLGCFWFLFLGTIVLAWFGSYFMFDFMRKLLHG